MLKQVVVTSAAAVALSATVAFASPATAVDTPIEVDRTSVAFGEVEIGTTATAMLTLTNTGTSNFGPINMFGGAPFTLQYGASQNCQAMVLPPGATCQLTYTFTPDGNGPFTDTSNFTISPTGSQSEGEDFLIPLTGSGCQGPACTTATTVTTTPPAPEPAGGGDAPMAAPGQSPPPAQPGAVPAGQPSQTVPGPEPATQSFPADAATESTTSPDEGDAGDERASDVALDETDDGGGSWVLPAVTLAVVVLLAAGAIVLAYRAGRSSGASEAGPPGPGGPPTGPGY